MKRRTLIAAAGTLVAAGAAAWWRWPSEGVVNPCHAALPESLARHEVLAAAREGVDPARMWDCHAHLVGTGDSGSGVWLSPQMQSVRNPVQYAQRLFYLNAGCVHDVPGRVDESYIERMHNLIDGLGPGVKLMLLAFDHTYTPEGERDIDRSAFHVPNGYAQRMAATHPRYFEWIASIHPYRRDCVPALEAAKRAGARAVKWLPAAMGIDPSSPRCDAFYEAAARLDVPLLTHAGLERAVHGADEQTYGNPLRLRRALDHGLRVIVAHCASMGEDHDLDRGPGSPPVASFELFARLMDEPRYQGLLFGDLSAMTQVNRAGPALKRVLERTDWHSRLLNGSDYPLPGIMPLFSVDYLVEQGFLHAGAAGVIKALRGHNPLLFDFVLKRHLRAGGAAFAPAVFETRDFFIGNPEARNLRPRTDPHARDMGGATTGTAGPRSNER